MAGHQPTVTFTVKDKSGAAVPLNQLENVSLVMAGPTSDYGYTSFGSDVTTPGWVSESATGAQCDRGNVHLYLQHAIPAAAKGSFAIGIESRRTETLLPGTRPQMEVRYGGVNKVFYFSVDGSPVQPRRTVAQVATCNQCHAFLNFHGDNRNQVEMCVLCHNTSFISTPDDPNQPAAGISFNLLIHRIHSSYKSYADVRYPAMSPQGGPGDTRNCDKCHVNDSQPEAGWSARRPRSAGVHQPGQADGRVLHRLPRHRGRVFTHAGEHDEHRRELRGVSRFGGLVRRGQVTCAVLEGLRKAVLQVPRLARARV